MQNDWSSAAIDGELQQLLFVDGCGRHNCSSSGSLQLFASSRPLEKTAGGQQPCCHDARPPFSALA